MSEGRALLKISPSGRKPEWMCVAEGTGCTMESRGMCAGSSNNSACLRTMLLAMYDSPNLSGLSNFEAY